MEYFIEVIIPLSLDTKYTYSVDPNQIKEISKGMRVVVPFGKSKSYTAIVYKLNSDAPTNYIAKEIDCVLDTKPIVPEIQIKFWEWISEYYQASIGDVYRTAIPSAFLLESQMEISKNNFPKDVSSLSDDEFLIYEALNISNLTVKEISEIVQKKHVLKILKDMLSKDYIDIMAPKIFSKINSNKKGISHVSSNRRSLYELALIRKKDVTPCHIRDYDYGFELPKDLSLKQE